MDNISKIKKISTLFYWFIIGFLALLPIYYISYWLSFNSESNLVDIEPLLASPSSISIKQQIIGFISSLLPLSVLLYGLIHIKRLFSFYKEGKIFSFEQVVIFKKISRALVLWVILSMVYESIKSVIFSWDNAELDRVLIVNLNSTQIGILILSIIMLVIAWIMDEARATYEENKLVI